MQTLVKDFKKKMNKEGRSYKWFHKNNIKGVSYAYFIIQLIDNDRMHDSIKKAITNFLSE